MSSPDPQTIKGWWKFLRPFFFQMNAETAHHFTLANLSAYSKFCSLEPPQPAITRSPALSRNLFGIHFPNLLGLAAGLDKNAEAIPAWQALGFGFIEVGTVTALAQPGNPKPRLFRLPKDRALMNRMGFNNHGAKVIGQRLAKLRESDRIHAPLEVNLGKSKVTDNADAAADYRSSFQETAEFSDYIVVNISSPNTPGLRDLQKQDEVKKILDTIGDVNEKRESSRPVLLKIAPDLADEDALICAQSAKESYCHGLIISNTTISREGLRGPVPEGSGGISGEPVFARSTKQLQLISESFPDFPCIGVGGIMNAAQACAKIEAGAALLQIYSGFIYGGPRFPIEILKGLLDAIQPPS